MLQFVSFVLMIMYAATKKRYVGAISWILFGIYWLSNVPYYLGIEDYFNTGVMVAAFVTFSIFGASILKNNDETFVRLTLIAAISSLIYFSFAETPLGKELIEVVARQTVSLASALGFDFNIYGDKIEYNGKVVQIILACTGIESISLFAGITIGTNSKLSNRVKAFLVSVPVIYVLNLLRNVFIVAAYGGEWFGENSFYVAHHVISKVLATLALILISMQVFKYLPEFADDIFRAKDLMVETWSRERE